MTPEQDYINYLITLKTDFYNKNRFDVVAKIDKQIKEAKYIQSQK